MIFAKWSAACIERIGLVIIIALMVEGMEKAPTSVLVIAMMAFVVGGVIKDLIDP
jgi:hypothetical protein